MVASQSAVYRRLRELQVSHDPALIADLFETISAASGSYGCEIWSTPMLNSWDAITSCSLQRYQASVYKRVLGAPTSTSNETTFFEMGRYPMQISWLVRVVKYWNKRVDEVSRDHARALSRCPVSSSSVMHIGCPELVGQYSTLSQVFCSNVHFGLVFGVQCWSKQLHDALVFVMPYNTDWKRHMLSLSPIDAKAVMHAAQQSFCQGISQYTDRPTQPDCPNRQRCKYAHWMLLGGLQASHSELPKVAYLTADIPCIKKHAVARARLGSAPVRAAIEHDTPYQERICRRCNQGVVDDECHWLFHCSALSHIRSKHAAVLRDRRSVEELMCAAYDDAEVAAFSDYIWDITQFVKGHRQGRSA